jgi:hypothetical protein
MEVEVNDIYRRPSTDAVGASVKTTFSWLLTLVAIAFALASPLAAENSNAPNEQTGNIMGTVTDVNDDTVPGAKVVLEGPLPADFQTVGANDNGYFEFHGLRPGVAYHVSFSAEGFGGWTSPELILTPGQYKILVGEKLRVAEAQTSITVRYSVEEIATEQVKAEEIQRVFGILPNFYVVYDPHPVPLTTKLKFKLALKVSIDPISLAGAAFIAGINQAADTPNYVQGAKGYGQRFGAVYADGVTDVMIGGAILPSLLHQDPRYFYQGTGTTKSRILHAVSNPFIAKGDNGRLQPNYSSIGGDLGSSAISNLYYPSSNRGAGLVFQNFAISTGQRDASSLLQEFVLGRLTRHAKD